MERSVEWFVAVSSVVIGLSHALRPGDWADAYRRLSASGRPGALINGALSLLPGTLIVAGHQTWLWPAAVITAFGWLLVAKGIVCLLFPDVALRSMQRGSDSPRGFVAAGFAALAIGGWAVYCLWYEEGWSPSRAQ